MAAVIAACLALAAFSLLGPAAPTYDPWAWLNWGRQVAELHLVTDGGPSWKPLPVIFTTPFSLAGAQVAPYLWLWVARAGALLAAAMTFRLARRLADPGGPRTGSWWPGAVGGLAAVAGLIVSSRFAHDSLRGNSEGLLVGLLLWAFERHQDGRRDHALYLAFAAALLRPEVWPFLGLYGIFLWVREPKLRLQVTLVGVLVPALWFLPEWWGSGDPLRASSRAATPNPNSPALAEHPALQVISRLPEAVVAPVRASAFVGGLYAVYVFLRRREERDTLVLAGLGAAWLGLVAAMTAAGYSGNTRYLIVPIAVTVVVAGVGVARTLQGAWVLGRRLPGGPWIAVATVLAVGLAMSWPFAHKKGADLIETTRDVRSEERIWHDLDRLIERGGGVEAVRDCQRWFTAPFLTQIVAYELRVPSIEVGIRRTIPPAAILQGRTSEVAPLLPEPRDPRFRLVLTQGSWRLLTVPPAGHGRCPAAGKHAPRVRG